MSRQARWGQVLSGLSRDDVPPPKLAGERFARHIAGARFADLPQDAIRAAKIFILDTFGVGIAGSTAPGTQGIFTTALRWGEGPEAAVWGRQDRVPASTAAFLNGLQVHGQEYDCVHEPAVLHPLATLLPAAMAWAERAGGVSGRDLLMAVAVGVDVSAGLGVASKQALRFFRPATSGGFGAVAACARLAGLDEAGVLSAFGMHYAQTSGTMQPHVEGSIALPMQVGFNSRAAITAADLAATGLVGPRDVFEGQYGYMRLFETEWDLGPVLDSLGAIWRVAQLSHKPYPAGRATHGGIEGVLTIRAEHPFEADDVESIIVYGPPIVVRLCGRPVFPDMTPTYARLSTPFALANVVRHGLLDVSHYRGAALHDPETLAFAARVTMEVDGNPDMNALAPQRVVVRLRNGAEHDWHCDSMLASPARPLTRAQHLTKFHRCWEFAADPISNDKRDTLVRMVDDLENVENVSALAALLQP